MSSERETETETEQARAAQMRRHALAMRLSGNGYRQIAETLGVPEPNAWKMVGVELQAHQVTNQDLKRRCRDEQLERLNIALRAIWPAVEAGQVEAVDCLLRLEERRSRLLGLDSTGNQETADVSATRLRPVGEASSG
jgi:hypothetical protein